MLLPERHPVRDFFVLDVLDVAPRSDIATMEHPIFSLSTRPEVRPQRYVYGDVEVEIIPSSIGLPTVFDKDVLIYCISKLVHLKNSGSNIGPYVRMTTHDMLVQTNRPTNNLGYERVSSALDRLAGVRIKTNLKTGNEVTTRGFGLIDEFEYNRKGSMFADRLRYLEIKLSDWVFRAIESAEVLPISRDYFRLRRPIDRRLYELARKHCGSAQEHWKIGVDKLQKKTGATSPRKKFTYTLRMVANENHLPDYTMALDGEFVEFTRRASMFKGSATTGAITLDKLEALLDLDVLEAARKLAVERGRDFQSLKHDFLGFMAAKGKPDNLNGAFLGFIKSKPSLRQGQFTFPK